MARLYTGCVLSGKTKLLIDFTELLDREEFLLFVPNILYHDGSQKVKTRAKGYKNLNFDIKVTNEINLLNYVKKVCEIRKIKGIFCDEIQFFDKRHIDQLIEIENQLNITVRCFGISKTHQDGTWDTVEYLKSKNFEITEILSKCYFCTNPATTNIRFDFNVESKIVDTMNDENVEKYLGCCKGCHVFKTGQLKN